MSPLPAPSSSPQAPTISATARRRPRRCGRPLPFDVDFSGPNRVPCPQSVGVPLVDVTFDYVATSAGDLPRVVFWNLDSSADMARQMIDNLKLAGYIPN